MARVTTTIVAGAQARAAAPKLPPAVIFRRNLGAIPGVVLGLSQPLVQIELSTLPHEAWDFSRLDAHMAELTGERPEPALAARNDAASLLLRLHHHYGALLRAANIPIFDRCHVVPAQANAATGMLDWRMTLPSTDAALTSEVLQWLVTVANLQLLPLIDRERQLAATSQQLEVLRRKLTRIGLSSTNMIHFLSAAHELGAGFEMMGSGVFAIGQGRNSRWLFSTITDRTPSIGCLLASNKQSTAQILRKHCLPAPEHVLVSDEAAAVKTAAQMGYPVVIKPLDQEQGRGVFAGLRDEKNLRIAYRAARKYSAHILVERHHEGEDYRISVMQDRVIKVMHRKAAFVLGDGRSTVADLIEMLQQAPGHQRAYRRTGEYRIEIDDEVTGLLEEQGLTPDDIPEAGRSLRLRRKSNISVGGTHFLYPVEKVHPDNIALALQASRLFGLDFAGIDLITPDITEPWHENGAVICEVNAQPQLGYRDTPTLYRELLSEMLGGDGRIPLYLMPVGRDMPPLERLFALAAQHGCDTLSTPDGIWRHRRQLAWAPDNSFAAARALVLDRQTGAGLMVMHHIDIARFGLPAADFTPLFPAGNAQAGDRAPDARGRQVQDMIRLHLEKRSEAD